MREANRVAWLSALVLQVTAGVAWGLGTYSMNPTDVNDRILPGFYPNLEVDVAYDDNISRVETNTTDTLLGIVKPELQWIGVIGKHSIRLGYQGEYARHASAGNEDYSDHFVGGDVTLDLTRKFTMNLSANFRREHEQRGNPGNLNTLTEPNRWQQWAFGAEAVYGRRIAKAQVAAKVEHRRRNYTNNNQTGRDYDSIIGILTFFYNLGPKTQLLVEPRYITLDYPNSNLDNDVAYLLVGVTWQATAKTTGELKVGGFSKDYDDPVRSDASGLAVDAKVIWKPRTYSTVTALLSRDVDDSDLRTAVPGVSSSVESWLAQLDWEHELTALTRLQAGASYRNDEYDIDRQDDTYGLYLGITRDIRRWLTVGARLDRASRDSSVAGNDYDDNRITIGVQSSLR